MHFSIMIGIRELKPKRENVEYNALENGPALIRAGSEAGSDNATFGRLEYC